MLAIIVGMSAFPQEKTYKIGDYYRDEDTGVFGYVFEVSDDGQHGKIYGSPKTGGYLISLTYDDMVKAGIPGKKSVDGEILPSQMTAELIWADATSDTDGQANTKKILRKLKEVQSKYGFSSLSEISPVYFALDNKRKAYWRDFGRDFGWYIPAIDELKSLYAAMAQDDFLELMKAHYFKWMAEQSWPDEIIEKGWKNVRISPAALIWSSTQLNPAKYGDDNCLVMNMADGQTLCYPTDTFEFWAIFIHKF